MIERIRGRADSEAQDPVLAQAARGEQDRGASPAAAAEAMAPAAVVEAFYGAFARRDGVAMGALYDSDASFSDPVFGSLRGDEIGAMWTMLCRAAPDLSVEASGIAPDGSTAHWEAAYTFPATGMRVRNSVDAQFTIRHGLIVDHVDSFDFYLWSRQALGLVGWLFGWTPFLRTKMTAASRAQLRKWQAKRDQR